MAKKQKKYKHCDYKAVSERDLTCELSADLQDAWKKLRAYAASLGEQRIYASGKAIMFSRKTCYLFVRPKKSFLETCIFLPQELDNRAIARATAVSKTKFANTFKLIHADQVEEPLTDWIAEAFKNCPS